LRTTCFIELNSQTTTTEAQPRVTRNTVRTTTTVNMN